MKTTALLLPFAFFINVAHAQLACDDNSIMSIKGTWKKHSDANMRADKNIVKIQTNIDKISKLFQLAYPEPHGMEAAWYRTMSRSSLIPNGPSSYEFNSLYKSWYCNKYQHKISLGDETGTWAYVFINSLGQLISNQYDLLSVEVDHAPVYILPAIQGEWKGYDLYEVSGHKKNQRCILLTHNNQVPWKTITQEQYLDALKKNWQERKLKSAKSYEEQEENIKKGITEIQNNRYLKTADKEKMIASQKKTLADLQKSKAADISVSDKLWNDKIAIIDNYAGQNASQLQQPAIIDRNAMNDFTGNFAALDNGGHILVTADPAYFNTKLPPYVPQLMVMLWTWDDHAPALNFNQQLQETFPVQKLKDMIDH